MSDKTLNNFTVILFIDIMEKIVATIIGIEGNGELFENLLNSRGLEYKEFSPSIFKKPMPGIDICYLIEGDVDKVVKLHKDVEYMQKLMEKDVELWMNGSEA